MKEYKLTEAEAKLADLIWQDEPLPSGDLVRICEAVFDWKKSTTYTMLKRLETKGIFKNSNGIIQSLIKKEAFHAGQSKQFVEEQFGGSLPKFLTAFARNKKLSHEEVKELQKLIDTFKEG